MSIENKMQQMWNDNGCWKVIATSSIDRVGFFGLDGEIVTIEDLDERGIDYTFSAHGDKILQWVPSWVLDMEQDS